MKVLVLISLALLLSACDTAGHPVPTEAFTKCLETGGTPDYHSNRAATTFKCEDTDE